MASQTSPSSTPVASPPWLNPEWESLRGSVGMAAVNGQNVHYPMVARSARDTPVPGQSHAIVSFMMLETPQETPGGRVFGFFKVRGCHGDLNLTKAAAANIVREQDSKSRNLITEVGWWMPLTNGQTHVKEELPVLDNATDQFDRIRISKIEEEQKLAAQKAKEVEDRKEEMLTSGDINDDPESIRYFVMKMVNWFSLKETIATLEKQKQELIAARLRSREIVAEKLSKHPEYIDEWLGVYNAGRAEAGCSLFEMTEELRAEFDSYVPVPKVEAETPAEETPVADA